MIPNKQTENVQLPVNFEIASVCTIPQGGYTQCTRVDTTYHTYITCSVPHTTHTIRKQTGLRGFKTFFSSSSSTINKNGKIFWEIKSCFHHLIFFLFKVFMDEFISLRAILCLIQRTTVTSLMAPKVTRCKTPIYASIPVFLFEREKKQNKLRAR